jgi:hypothetical protein
VLTLFLVLGVMSSIPNGLETDFVIRQVVIIQLNVTLMVEIAAQTLASRDVNM